MIPRWLIRLVATSIQQVRLAGWFLRRSRGRGVHAVVLTPENKVVLVRLTYARGWRLPRGGLKAGEEAQSAMLRELREEIGLTGFAAIAPLGQARERIGFVEDESTIFLVTGAHYGPRQSFEIDAIAEFDPSQLPPDTSTLARREVARASAARAD